MTSHKTDLDNRIVEEEAEQDEEYTEMAPPQISHWKLVMRSQTTTIILQVLGTFAAAAAGTARPLMAIFYGHLVNIYNNGTLDKAAMKHDINRKVLMLLCIFIGQWVFVCMYGILFSVAAMRYTMRMRALYLNAVVSQDIEHVSEFSAATDLSINASIIEEALSEKLGTIVQGLSTIATAIIVSFYWSPKLAASLLFFMLVLVFKDFFITMISTKLEKRIQSVEAEATTLAEECISGIRTVTAFGAASKFTRRYGDILDKTKKMSFSKSPLAASHKAISYLFTLSVYSMAFWYGSILLRRGQIHSPGVIFM